MPADVAEIRRTLGVLCEPGQVVEVRALEVNTPRYPRSHTVSGYFNDYDLLARQVPLIEKAKGIYLTLNPVNDALLARAMNRLRAVSDRDALTADSDIIARRWLPIDADPVRPSGISSTDAEHDAATVRIREIREALQEMGWPEPVIADSGNGGHVLYRMDLPNDAPTRDLLRRVLEALAFRFDDAMVMLDQKVFNAARIWKLYGTVACKGDNTPVRPHRLARLVEVPERGEPVAVSLLQALAKVLPEPTPATPRRDYRGAPFDVERWIAEHLSGDLIGPRPWQGGRRWIFRVCPWNSDHRNRSAFIVEHAGGAISAGCHHNGCVGNDWHALRHLVEPGWDSRRTSPTAPTRPQPTPRPTRPSAPTPVMPKGLIGLEDADDPVIWVGSAEEKAVLMASGYRSCVAVPEIPPLKTTYRRQLSYLSEVEEILLGIHQHILFLPNTPDGRALTVELTRRLGPERCWRVAWPSECETVEHVLVSHGLDIVAECVHKATPVPIQGVVRIESLIERLKDWYDHGSPQGVETGWRGLDAIYRVLPGEVTLITGVPSTGKSTFVSALLVNLARLHDWSIASFSAEMAPPERLARLMVRQYEGAPFDVGLNARMSWADAEKALRWLDQHMSFLWPKDQLPTVAHLLELAAKQVFRGVKGIVIDPWNRVAHQRPNGMSETDYIGQSLAQIQRFAQISGVHVWIVAHPTKIFKEGDKYPVVTPNLIAGSANWWSMADNILSLWRDHGNVEDHQLDIHSMKIRFEENGRMGQMAKLRYHPASGRFSEF